MRNYTLSDVICGYNNNDKKPQHALELDVVVREERLMYCCDSRADQCEYNMEGSNRQYCAFKLLYKQNEKSKE